VYKSGLLTGICVLMAEILYKSTKSPVTTISRPFLKIFVVCRPSP